MIHASLKAKSNLSSAACLMLYLLEENLHKGVLVYKHSAFCASVPAHLTSISPKNPGRRGN